MIVVTGGTGFVGRRLIKRIQGEYKIITRKPSDKNHEKADIRRYEDVLKATKDAEVIIHLAVNSNHFGSFKNSYETNVIGTKNLLKAAEKNQVEKFIYLSSAAVNSPYNTNYTLSKKLAEQEVLKHLETMNISILRPSFIYDEKRISAMKKAFMLPFPFKKQKLRLCYIETITDAIIKAVEKGKNKIYEVGDKKEITLTELRKAVTKNPLWVPGFLIETAAIMTSPIEIITSFTDYKIPISSFILNSFTDKTLNVRESARELKYKQYDTIKLFKQGAVV